MQPCETVCPNTEGNIPVARLTQEVSGDSQRYSRVAMFAGRKKRPIRKTGATLTYAELFSDYCNNNFLNSNTHTKSIQPNTKPKIVTIMLIIKRTVPPFFK